jgi:hypothetical protein
MAEGTGIGAGSGIGPDIGPDIGSGIGSGVGPAEARMVARRASVIDDPLDALPDITATVRVEPRGEEFFVSVIVRTGTPPDHRAAVFEHLEAAVQRLFAGEPSAAGWDWADGAYHLAISATE